MVVRRARIGSAVSALVLLAALLGVLAGGCGLMDGRSRVGTLVHSWSQGQDDRIADYAPKDTLVIADREARERFLAQLPDDADTRPVLDVDLTENFLVLGSYSKCKQQSRVWMDTRRTAVWMEVFVPKADRGTACAWSPLTIDVWAVPRDELKSTPADRLRTGDGE